MPQLTIDKIKRLREGAKIKSNIEKFCDWLDEEGIKLCGVDFGTEMEEQYCPFFKKEYKGINNGFCLAKCDEDCDVKYFESIDQVVHVDCIPKIICDKHEVLLKRHPIRQDLFCPECKPNLVI